jgi:hypothetical protein
MGVMSMMVTREARFGMTPSVPETTSRVDALKLHLFHPFMSVPGRLVDRLELRVLRMVSSSRVRVRMRCRMIVLRVQLRRRRMVVVSVGMPASMMPTGLSMGVIPMRVTMPMRVLMPIVFMSMRVVVSVICMSMMAM